MTGSHYVVVSFQSMLINCTFIFILKGEIQGEYIYSGEFCKKYNFYLFIYYLFYKSREINGSWSLDIVSFELR